MANYFTRAVLFFAVLILATPPLPAAWGDDLDMIRVGDHAIGYAAGSIQKMTPQDGIVNVITGDNQTVGDRMIVGQRDTLYLRLKNPGDAAIGDLYTIYKRARKVFHPNTREYLGYLVNRLAIVQVVQVDRELTTTTVLRAYGAVAPGDPVVRFALPSEGEAGTEQASGSEVQGRIVDFQSDMGVMNLVAQRNVVYLDRGREDGVRAGGRMEVVRTGGGLPRRVVGELKVLTTEGKTATALITKSTSRILLGDRFHVKVLASGALPLSQPTHTSSNEPSPATTVPRKFQVQNVASETRISLGDLMKQLRYESGEATIKPEGYQILDELIAYLKNSAGEQLIRVEGHADNMEIGPSLKSMYPTNWDLSKARASGVLRYLVEKGGIDSAKLSSIGYGDSRPVVSNATEPGRQKNRRVDIVLSQPGSVADPAGSSTKAVEPSGSGVNVSRLGLKGSDAPSPTTAAVDEIAPKASTTPTSLEPPPLSEPASVGKPESVIQDAQDAMDGKSESPAVPPQEEISR